MLRSILYSFIFSFVLVFSASAQDMPASESELKEKAATLFETKEFNKARPLYAQLLSLYTKDTDYNFKYGVTLLETTSDKSKPIPFLEFAAKQRDAPSLVYFYLGRAYHFNYDFNRAIKQYKKFKALASKSENAEYLVDRQIEMCENGNSLLRSITDVQVLDKRVVSEDNFYRVYDLEGIEGKIIAKPEAFMSRHDKRVNDRSIIYLPDGDQEVYFSSYGHKGENGRDIYKITRLGNNQWGEAVNVGAPINTPYDEDFAFIHPDKRTLYFASKGHNSMGGYDLFMSTYDEEKANWSEPVNLDFAFSSVNDDILFISDKGKELAYFASNRSNDEGEITVYKVMTKKKPANISLIKGKLYAENAKAMATAKLTVVNMETNHLVGVFHTDNNGEYQVEIPENGGKFEFSIETSQDQPIHSGIVEVPKQNNFEVLGQELRLVGEGVEQQLEIKNIFDGSVAQKYKNPGEFLSPTILSKRATLDVNMSEEELENKTTKSQADIEKKPTIVSKEDKPSKSETVGTDAAKEIDQLEIKSEEKIHRLNSLSNALYSKAFEHKNKAEEKFKAAAVAKNNGEGNWKSIELEGKKLALKAALSFEQAEYASRVTKEKKESQKKLKEYKIQIISGNETTNEEQILLKSRAVVEAIPTVNELSQNQIDKGKVERAELNEELKVIKEKAKSLKSEQEDIVARIAELKSAQQQMLTASEKATNKSKIADLQTDSDDLSYQIQLAEEKAGSLLSNISVYEVQEKEIESVLIVLKDNKNAQREMQANEKDKLRNDLKRYRDENKFAHIESSKSTQDNRLKEIDKKYEDKLESSEVGSEEQRVERQRDVFGDWISELKSELQKKESALLIATSATEKQKLNAEIIEIKREIDDKSIRLNNLDATGDDKVIADTQREEVENENLVKKKELKSSTAVKGVDDVDENTIIDDSFSSFSIDQNYNYHNQATNADISLAKKSLYEAKTLSEGAELKKASIFELKTTEERETAFQQANALEKKSKEKQIIAIEKYSEANKKEYLINSQRLLNANTYSSDFNSSKLDVANLLSEEADNYYEQANDFRASITPTERLSKKEVTLQKAYDYELLALKRQRAALETLEMVDKEYQNREESNTTESYTIIQTIEDEEVLKLNSSEEAEENAERLKKEAKVNYERAEELKEEVKKLPVGEERNKLIAEIETLENSANQKSEKAKLYEKRKEQLNLGYSSAKSVSLGEGILKPQSIDDLDVVNVENVELSEENEKEILKSTDYIDFRDQQLNLNRMKKEADVEYQKAIALQENQQELKFEAQKLRNQAEETTSPIERERLVKEAMVIDVKVNSRQNSIDSLNRVLKVKNYLIEKGVEKRATILEGIPKEKRASVLYITEKHINEGTVGKEIATVKELSASELGVSDDIVQSAKTSETPTVNKEVDVEAAIKTTEVEKKEDDIKVETERAAVEAKIESNRMQGESSDIGNVGRSENKVENATPIEDKTPIKTTTEKVDKAPLRANVGFKIIDSESSAYNENRPIPTNKTLPSGLVYKVQVGAFRNPIPQDMFKGFSPLMVNEAANGIKRYTAGMFNTESPATIARNQIRELGYTDAFVVAFFNGERIDLNLARRISDGTISENDFKATAPKQQQQQQQQPEPIINTKLKAINQAAVKDLPKEPTGDDAGRVAIESVDYVFYTIQLGVFSKPLEVGHFDTYEPLNFILLSNGMRRYNTGVFKKLSEAQQFKEQLLGHVPDAFITAYSKGKRISLSEAENLINKK